MGRTLLVKLAQPEKAEMPDVIVLHTKHLCLSSPPQRMAGGLHRFCGLHVWLRYYSVVCRTDWGRTPANRNERLLNYGCHTYGGEPSGLQAWKLCDSCRGLRSGSMSEEKKLSIGAHLLSEPDIRLGQFYQQGANESTKK